MSRASSVRAPVVDWLTVVAIAAIAISLTVAFHEGVHALTCVVVGGRLQEYSALYAECDSATELQARLVAGSAPTLNLIAGTVLWMLLRKSRERAPETQFFLWLLMAMNWWYGGGYLIMSGIVGIGDWAVVTEGWEPTWLWRVLLTVVGTLLTAYLIWLVMSEFAMIIGGDEDERIRRANKLCILSYVASFLVILMAGFFCPYGPVSLPVTAGLFAVGGALSPLLWMMRWFRSKRLVKRIKEPLEIHRKWGWLVGALIVVFMYAVILGQTLYF